MLRFNGAKYKHCTSVILNNYLPLNRQRCALLSSQSGKEDFAPGYKPNVVESGKYEQWGKIEFPPSQEHVKPFRMIMPPPNITGTLHLGHALTLAIQDVLVRWHRMRGGQTLWVPGMDHAGIATQVVVEKKLWQEQKKTRHDIGREKFEQEIWKWKQQKSEVIRQQVRRLGALPNWSREYFTMDEKQSRAVTEAFIRLFDSGLIYRSDYLVNWSCVLQSAISDIEVEHLEVQGRTDLSVPGYEQPVQFGALTKFAYKFCEMDGELVVSTTRPETLLGDVAVAVHPTDERYASLEGRHVLHPFRQEPIPIIRDEFVDPAFGTGAVKVTPAHDPVDFEVGKRHGLATLQVIDERGDIMHAAGTTFAGMKRFSARRAVTARLETLGLLRSVEDHPMSVPLCSRSRDVVEYIIKPQWFVGCSRMAHRAMQDVTEGRLTIEPATFEKVWFNWLENIRDWCISRQLWWGHRVPAYQCHMKQNVKGPKVWVAADNPRSAQEKASVKLSSAPEDVVAVQDEDVLDTWFSSSLLPFALFGWPSKTADLSRYYPLTLMETGHDILFFWVARMVMLGTELTGSLPFSRILLHGVVCDAHGRKMSKSLGNVISPEDVISGITLKGLERQARTAHAAGLLSTAEAERAISGQSKMFPSGIPECGADALRFTLCSHNIKSHFINFDVSECYTNKLFCNKIWQACRFTRISVKSVAEAQSLSGVTYEDFSVMDRWILSRLSWMVAEVNEALHRNDFHVATSALKQFLYSELCDVHVETTKPGLRFPAGRAAVGHVSALVRCLDTSLRSIAPFMPHLAEELHMHLPDHPDVTKYSSIMYAPYPETFDRRDVRLEAEVQIALDTVTVIRRLRKLFNITAKYEPKAHIISTSPTFTDLSQVIATLSGCHEVTVAPDLSRVVGTTVSDTVGNYATVHMPVPSSAAARMEDDRARLSKKIDRLVGEMDKLERTVNADGFRTKAPPKVQEAHANKLASLRQELHRLQRLQRS